MITELTKDEIGFVTGAAGEEALIGSGLGWVAGRYGGARAGGLIGAGIGSFVPGFGTVAGAILGTAVGGMYGPGLGTAVGGYIGGNISQLLRWFEREAGKNNAF
jgi:hypothetical protein